MKILPSSLEGIKIIECNFSQDNRGSFTKIYNEDEFHDADCDTIFRETYYSSSQKDVIRGMHFQFPPYDHEKLVHVIKGSILDVVVDLRKNSSTYKKHETFILTAKEHKALWIPKGFAHGFKSLEDDTIMLYQVASGYHSNYDSGIAYDSIGFDWGIENPIISERDKKFVKLEDFDSPF